MSGKVFVIGFLFVALAFFLLALLFNFYPPAANSPLTLAGIAVYGALAWLAIRRTQRK
jgi:hypothetical protein